MFRAVQGDAKRPFILFGLGLLAFATLSILENPDFQKDAAPTQRAESPALYSENVEGKHFQDVQDGIDQDSPLSVLIDIPFKFLMDESGNLRVSGDLKSIFDMYLSLSDRLTIDQITSAIDTHMASDLVEPALTQAKRILMQYLEMKSALLDAEEQLITDQYGGLTYFEQLKTRKSLRDQVRSRYLDQDILEAFYQEEMAYDQYVLAKLSIELDESLEEHDRSYALEVLNSKTDPVLLAQREEAVIVQEVETRVQALRSSGQSEQEVQDLRRAHFGEEAVARFEVLEAERANWQSRVDTFAEYAETIGSHEGLTSQDRTELLNQALEEHFNERERIRVRAILSSKNAHSPKT